MYELSEAGRLSIVSLFRQIIQQNPHIQVLDMNIFSGNEDREENICELILVTLLNSNIDSIIDLDLSGNESWFWNPFTGEERLSNVDLLTEHI